MKACSPLPLIKGLAMFSVVSLMSDFSKHVSQSCQKFRK